VEVLLGESVETGRHDGVAKGDSRGAEQMLRTLRIFPQETKVDAKLLSLCALTQPLCRSRALSQRLPRAAHRRCFRSYGGALLVAASLILFGSRDCALALRFLKSFLVVFPCTPGPPALHNPARRS